jgi:hypothetical protein
MGACSSKEKQTKAVKTSTTYPISLIENNNGPANPYSSGRQSQITIIKQNQSASLLFPTFTEEIITNEQIDNSGNRQLTKETITIKQPSLLCGCFGKKPSTEINEVIYK